MRLDHLADLLSEHAPAPSAPRKSAEIAGPPYAAFKIEANNHSVSVSAPAQQVATAPFQPIAERTNLPALLLTYRWTDLRTMLALYERCEPVPEHPMAPWLERIVEHVRAREAIEIVIRPFCEAWICIRLRSVWTGLERDDLLTAAQIGGCDTHEQALARAEVVATRLRAAGRMVLVNDRIASAPKLAARPVAPPEDRKPAVTKQVRVGQIVLTFETRT